MTTITLCMFSQFSFLKETLIAVSPQHNAIVNQAQVSDQKKKSNAGSERNKGGTTRKQNK